MPNNAELNALSFFGGLLRGFAQKRMLQQQQELKGQELTPVQEYWRKLAEDIKQPPKIRQKAHQMFLQSRGIDPSQVPEMDFSVEEISKTPSERMSTVATEKGIPKYQFPSFEGALEGQPTKIAGYTEGLTPEQKMRGIQNIAIDTGVPQNKVDQFLQNYGLKAEDEQEEPELTLSQAMDRYARADQAGKERMKQMFPQFEKYFIDYEQSEGGGLGLEFHSKAREIQRLRTVIDEYDQAIKALTYGKNERPMLGREKEVKRLKAERETYRQKMKGIRFYGEDIALEPEKIEIEGIPEKLERSGKKKTIPGF